METIKKSLIAFFVITTLNVYAQLNKDKACPFKEEDIYGTTILNKDTFMDDTYGWIRYTDDRNYSSSINLKKNEKHFGIIIPTSSYIDYLSVFNSFLSEAIGESPLQISSVIRFDNQISMIIFFYNLATIKHAKRLNQGELDVLWKSNLYNYLNDKNN
jgi:hypothetical protein